jgi:hypothetical protein
MLNGEANRKKTVSATIGSSDVDFLATVKHFPMANLGALSRLINCWNWGRPQGSTAPRGAGPHGVKSLYVPPIQCVLDIYSKVPDRILDLGVPEQNLDRTKVARRL